MDASSPAALSIHQVARLHCREEILTEPLHWTSRHLELLQCSFGEPSPAPPTTQSDYTGELSATAKMKWYLKYYGKYSTRETCIRCVLSAPGCPFNWGKDLYFYLNIFPVKTLPCVYLCLRNSESEQPVAAYIDRDRVEVMRKNTLYRPRNYNPPVSGLYQRKYAKIKPAEPMHDPYIVALLIAVAQRQRRVLRKADKLAEETETFPSKVLVSFKTKECVHLYTADISSSLLDKFDYPAVPPPAPPSISIRITTIPLEPCETLRDRLFALMLPATGNSSTGRKRKLDDEGIHHQSPRQDARREDVEVACS